MEFPFDRKCENVTYMIMDVKYIKSKNVQEMSLPGIEPGTLSVLNSCDNHCTTGTHG